MANEGSALDGLAGTTVGGKYKLVRPLGSGGMGFVYQAEQLGLGRSVAVKLVRRDLLTTRFEWFRAEALAASRINHPNAVAIYDFGVTESGVPYLVMEHLSGTTLTDLIGQRAIDTERAVDLGAQILSALEEAHACGVIHCDLTGTNVIVEHLRDGRDLAKVIDFGLARLADSPVRARSLGTAEYTAPEQIRGDVISPKTDLYAVGILLFEMIVGRTPFAGHPRSEILEQHLSTVPPRVDELVKSCPTALADLIAEALSKSQNDRPDSGRAMMESLLGVTAAGKRKARTGKKKRTTLRFGAPPSRYEMPHPRSHRASRLDLDVTPRHRLVARKSELAAVEEFLAGNAPVLQIVGPSGMGKARLIAEAVRKQNSRDRVFVGAADPTGLRTPWYPILTAIEAVFEGRRIETETDLKQAVARAGLRERELPGLAEIFAIPGPAQSLERDVRHREAIAAASRALSSVHRRHDDAVLCFADVNRYDVPSRKLVEKLAAEAGPGSIRLLITSNHYQPAIGGVEVRLKGLTPSQATELVRVLTDSKRAPKDSAIAAITHGSPAAIEQLAGWLNMGQYMADAPSVLVDLISVRVNRLPAEARRALQAIAVHGSIASREVLELMLDSVELGALEEVDTTGLIDKTNDSYVIPSELAANVIAACTPADVRRRLHFKVLEAFGPDVPFAVRAHHARHAGELGRAFSLFMEAGHDAVRRFDDPGAAHWYGQAMGTARELQARGVPTADRDFVAASLTLAETLRRSGETSLAKGVLAEANSVLVTDQQRCASLRCSALIDAEFDLERAANKLGQAIAAALAAGDTEMVAQTYLDLARVKANSGDLISAVGELEQVIELLTAGAGLASATGPARLWRIGMTLAEMQVNLGRVTDAMQTARGTLAFAQRVGSARARARISALLALICDQTGDHTEALALRASALEQLRGLGDRRSTAELLISRVKGTGDTSAAAVARTLSKEIGWDAGVVQANEVVRKPRD